MGVAYAKNTHNIHEEYGYHTQGLCVTYARNTHTVSYTRIMRNTNICEECDIIRKDDA